MKNKYYLYGLFAAALTLTGCDYNEDHFPGYDELAQPKDVWNDTITLADADYKTIAGIEANKELALSKDPEGETFKAALEAVAGNKYFTEEAPAVWYLPAYIASKYPYMDDNSKVTVHYKNYENLPEYLKAFNGMKAYDMNSDDYKVVWGDKVSVSYISPSTLNKIPAALKEGVAKPADGEMRMVNYAYSETEPSFGGGEGEPEVTYTPISEIVAGESEGEYNVKGEVIATYGRGFLLSDKTASILVYLNAPANYSVGDVVTVTGTTSKYSGLMQFPQSSTVTLIERSEEFAYPAAQAMTGAEMDAWTVSAAVKYVSITGKLTINKEKGYYNLVVDGATRQGSLSYPVAGLVDDALDGQNVTAIGYLIGYNGSFVNMMTTSVVAAGSQSEYIPVGVVALSAAGDYQVKGTVAALYGRGFLLNDGTGSILVYLNKESENKVGDVVTVSGTTSPYAGFMQFGKNIKMEKVGESTFKYPAVRTLTGADMDAYLEMPYVAYVEYVGTLKIEGNYLNVTIDGAETAVGSLSYAQVDPALNGKKVVVTGYSIGVSGGKFVNTMVVTVKDAAAAAKAYAAVTRAAATRAAVKANTSALYRYNASSQSWSKYSTDEAEVAVLQPADYDKMGYSYVSKPAETMPVYLKQAYPYAKTDDVVAVAYYADKNSNLAVTEFKFDGATWIETTIAVPTTITFQKANGEWVEARVYFESTFLGGDSGGFVAEDIELSGLTKIWSLESSYGWKGTGFLSENKKTESYLVSPEIDLSKAAAPSVVFDCAINYLKGAERSENFNLLISTDYAGDAASASWKTLEVTGWPAEDSWAFVTVDPLSLADYVGKKIRLAFHYKSTSTTACTVEVKNMSVKE